MHARRRGADPGTGVAAEQAGVVAHVVLARLVVTGADHEAQTAVLQRIAGEEVQGAAEGLVRARGDISGALADFHRFQVQGVDVAVGQRAAAVAGAAVGQAVDGGADLLRIAVGDEATHADLRAPHRRTGSVGLADHHARHFVQRIVDAAHHRLPVQCFCAHRRLGVAGGLADHLYLVQGTGIAAVRFARIALRCFCEGVQGGAISTASSETRGKRANVRIETGPSGREAPECRQRP